jgi:hypothetical protein
MKSFAERAVIANVGQRLQLLDVVLLHFAFESIKRTWIVNKLATAINLFSFVVHED